MRTVIELIRRLLCGHKFVFGERMPSNIVRVVCLKCGAERVEHRA